MKSVIIKYQIEVLDKLQERLAVLLADHVENNNNNLRSSTYRNAFFGVSRNIEDLRREIWEQE